MEASVISVMLQMLSVDKILPGQGIDFRMILYYAE